MTKCANLNGEEVAHSIWTKNFAWLIALIVLSRLLIVSNTEMIGPPFDADGLAWLTLNGFWERPSDSMRPPMLPLVSEAVMRSGLPWRLFLEGIFVLATMGFVIRLRPYLGSIAASLCAVVVLFNPYTLRSFTEFQREPFLLVLYLAWFWTIFHALQDRQRTPQRTLLSMVSFSLLGAAIILTREGEEVFVFGGVALVLAGQLYLALRRRTSLKVATLTGLGVPAMVIGLSLMIIAQINHDTWGIWHYRGILPSYQALLTQVHRIDVEDSIRFAPATRESFRVAMQLSPTFKTMGAPAIANDDVAHGGVNTWRAHSSEFVGRREIDPTRTIWLISLLINSVQPPDDRVQSTTLQTAAAEIKGALDRGEWPSHSLNLPYPLDPNIENWIGFLPASLVENGLMLLVPTPEQAGRRDFTDHHAPLFDESLNRRGTLVQGQFGGLRDGWREIIVYNYGIILAVMAFAIVLSSKRRASKLENPFGLTVLVLSGVVLCRFFVYTVMYISVAPVDRYQVFFSPIAALILILVLERLTSLAFSSRFAKDLNLAKSI